MQAKPLTTLTPLEDALSQLLEQAVSAQATKPQGLEWVGLLDADGRVLAEDLIAGLDVPGFDNSAMDGYALRCEDALSPDTVLPVRSRVAAGEEAKPIEPMTLVRIFTGAPIPQGADAVLMQEDTQVVNDCEGGVRLLRAPAQGDNIRRRGHDIAKGALVLKAGTRLNPATIGLAASIGVDRFRVYQPLRVALISTGDELVSPGTIAPDALPAGAIFNSNRYFLQLLLRRTGVIVTDGGIVPDTLEATIEKLQALSLDHDVILSSGGVSVGEEDHVKAALEMLGSLQLWKLAMKPGKPFAYGQILRATTGKPQAQSACHFLGLPGNPVASFATFLLLAKPFLLALQGVSQDQLHEHNALYAPADFDFSADKRRQFLRVRLTQRGKLALFADQSSSVLTSVVWASGFADIAIGQAVQRGDMLRYLPFVAH